MPLMKKVKLVNILLLLMFSFSVVHSFALEEEHHHHISEQTWIGECSHVEYDDVEDTHNLYCEFHHSYVLTQNFTIHSHSSIYSNPLFISKVYTYYKTDNFLKPPIA